MVILIASTIIILILIFIQKNKVKMDVYRKIHKEFVLFSAILTVGNAQLSTIIVHLAEAHIFTILVQEMGIVQNKI